MFASTRIFRLLLLLSFVASFGNSNIIQVNKECYSVGEDISITFEITDAQPRDFIGIYLPGDSMATLPDPSGIHWLWTCGSRSCTSTDGISRAVVTYKDNLEVGMWKVTLAHNNGPPYVGIVESKSFLVSSACSGVTATPTINRASEPTNPSSVMTDKSSYQSEVPILVSFDNKSPKDGDWIGIYPASVDSINLRQASLWKWTCGSDCLFSVGKMNDCHTMERRMI